ncbi:MAG TPA: class C beta-lactamase-related serine hydrolase [bacterium]|nr:class C beta-lactamase-related serine hydrolase [bacterium]
MRRTAALLVFPFAVTTLAAQQPDEQVAQIACAYTAKITASAIFVSGRTLASVKAQELAPTRPIEEMIRRLLQIEVDRAAQSVTCTLGDASATAVFRPWLGCALVTEDVDADELRAQQPGPLADAPAASDPEALWPDGERVDPRAADGLDREALEQALDTAMAEPSEGPPVHTRALVVVHDGRIVGERYADGFAADMPLPGWSMSKTLTNALLGMRAADGEFDPTSRPRVPYWRGPRDPRTQINYGHLLAMTAGIEWDEDYENPASDAVRMLFASTDHAAVYARKRAAARPGSRFHYASGASNLLCRVLRASFDDDESYWAHAQRLFRRLGMRTAVLETDPSGTFVGSSYGYASARDWARLGLLYLQDGVFAGERILPEGWVAQSTTPTEASHGRYGWHIWLNADPAGEDADGEAPSARRWPDLPADLYYMAGHEGQACVVSPSARLVVVRLGCTKQGAFDLAALLQRLHAALR